MERQDDEKLFHVEVEGTDEMDVEPLGIALDNESDLPTLPDCKNVKQPSPSLSDDDDEIAIQVDATGSISALADQVMDYMLRPKELENMCLWDFVAETDKRHGSNERMDTKEQDERCTWDGTTYTEDQNVEQGPPVLNMTDQNGSKHGQPLATRYEFLPDHREKLNKHICMRKENVIPVPIGSAMPRQDQPDVYAHYCHLMLILFKPWRTVVNLQNVDNTWENMFSCFIEQMKSQH